MSEAPSNRALGLAGILSKIMVDEKMTDVREALAFSLAGFLILSGDDEDEAMEHFMRALAWSMEALNIVNEAPLPGEKLS